MEPPTAALSSRLIALGPTAAGRCRRRVHLDADPLADRSARIPLTDGARHRLADMAEHRRQVLDKFRALFPVTAEWQPENGARPAVVLEPSLSTATRFGSPDVLLWSGDGYLPIIIRSHRTTDPGAGAELAGLANPFVRMIATDRKPRHHQLDALTLAHHHRLLGELGLASSQAWGGVIGRGMVAAGAPAGHDDGAVVLWYPMTTSGILADYDRRFADRIQVAAAAAAGGPALAAPSRVGECRRCAWWPLCVVRLTADHDISLISAGDDVEVLQAAGIRTVDQLAASPTASIQALPLTGVSARTAKIRARAWLGGLPLVRLDTRTAMPRADVELDVDMESYLDDGAYLWGTYLTGAGLEVLGLEPGYRPFVSWRALPDADEGRAFAEFWTFLVQVRRRATASGQTFRAYCYSRSAEERWMRSAPRRFPTVPGMPSISEVEAFCGSAEWVDIYQQIRDQFVVTGSMKLKVLAPLAGFHWRDAEPGGENSMAWYRAAIGGPDAPADVTMAQRVLQYNEDDVLATLALRRYITERGHELPTVADLDRD